MKDRAESGRGAPVTGRRISATAPIRICDIGGWTDTWFARRGNIFNIAVSPNIEVQIDVGKRTRDERVRIQLENYGQEYQYDQHPLIGAAIDVIELPGDLQFDINIFSVVPPGASTGTSAAVSVALLGALDRLTYGMRSQYEIAALAHHVETEKLGLQSGIQDQICSAYGGINYIQMYAFPHASVSPLCLPMATLWELENRLALVYIGSPHGSSDVHRELIADLGEDAENNLHIARLRTLAAMAKRAILRGDFVAFGQVMDENTDEQRRMHHGLVCDSCDQVIGIARAFHVLGCKVNGAGGNGGSLTILTDGDMARKRQLLVELEQEGFRHLDIFLSPHGLRVWDNDQWQD